MAETETGPRATFTREDFESTMKLMTQAFQMFALVARQVPAADVARCAETVRTADAVGWVVDPTRYRDAMESGSLARQRELVDVFTATKARLMKLFPDGWDHAA